MKLFYDMEPADQAAFDAAADGERLLYCVPYNVQDGKFVSGYIAITPKRIYKLFEGRVLRTYELAGAVNFRTEVLYGSGGFYGNFNGATELVCQFVVGRHLPRYAVLVRACELLAEHISEEPITNDTPERFCPKCNRPYISHSTLCPFCMNKWEVYGKLWAMTKGLRLMLFFPFVVLAVSTTFMFVSPVISRHLIDNYLNRPDISTAVRNLGGYAMFVAMLVGIDLIQRALNVVQSRLMAIAAGRFLVMMRTLLYEKIQSLSLASIQRKSTGDLMGRVNYDTSVMQQFITGQLTGIIQQVFSILLAAIFLFVLNWRIALFVIIPIPFAIVFVTRFWSFVHSKNMRLWMIGSRRNYLLQDILNGVRVVKSFGQEDREIDRFRDINTRYSDQEITINNIWQTMFPWLMMFLRLGSYFIIYYGGLMIIRGTMTLGEYNQFSTYANYVFAPLLAITNIPSLLSNFITSSSKVFEILEETPEITDIGLPIDIRIEGNISVQNVTFGYNSYNPVLEDVNLEVKEGEMLGVVGHSGSGKTTLINLLMRLYDVNEGQIVIDGVNIRDISQEALRSQIGVVLQETFLFSGTIRENIRYSKPHATDEEVIEAARVANAHDFIVSLPDGYNTYVGEKGYSLSGGERQRVAIARAVIHNPRILILDEATASLDTETEKLIQDALNRLVTGRTTIAIAHRLSTLRNADKLLVLDKGKVAEFGTHSELLENHGIYYKLVKAQQQMAQRIAVDGDEDAELEF